MAESSSVDQGVPLGGKLASLREQLACSGIQTASNDECRLYVAKDAKDNGYINVTYRHPVTGRRACSNIHRLALMLSGGTFKELPSDLDASHLCHNKICVRLSHLSLEPRQVNLSRKRCVKAGQCKGHLSYPECLLHLRLSGI